MAQKIQSEIFGTLTAHQISREELPADELSCSEEYKKFYRVERGPQTWYIGSGHELAPRQYVVWFPNRKFYSGFGLTMTDAFNNATKQAAWYM